MGLLTQALASSSSTAVVVGSSQGIGLAFVNALLHRGRGRVIAATRRPAASPDSKVRETNVEQMLQYWVEVLYLINTLQDSRRILYCA